MSEGDLASIPKAIFSDDELSRLREIARTPRTPWWRNFPLLVAGAGFLLSLTTAAISAYVAHRKDIHDRQTQLATTIQTIQELTSKHHQLLAPFASRGAETATQLQHEDPSIGMIVALVSTLHRRGVELARGLGTNASTGELIVLVEGAYSVGDIPTSEQLLQLALKSAQTVSEESITLRRLGFLKIRTSTTLAARLEGEEFYNKAANLDRKYQGLPEYAQNFNKAVAKLDWADAIAPFNCPGAQSHFEEGVASMEKNPLTPEMQQMRQKVLWLTQTGLGGAKNCRPRTKTTEQ